MNEGYGARFLVSKNWSLLLQPFFRTKDPLKFKEKTNKQTTQQTNKQKTKQNKTSCECKKVVSDILGEIEFCADIESAGLKTHFEP